MTDHSREQELFVEGMTCASCARTVSRYLEEEGMTEVFVDLPKQKVTFRSVGAQDLPETLMDGIDRLGYHVVRRSGATSVLTLNRKLLLSAVLTAPMMLDHLLHLFGQGIPGLDLPWVQCLLTIPVFWIGILHFGKSAWAAVVRGTTNMDVLIILGSSAAFVYSCLGLWTGNPDYFFFETSAAIITLVLAGNWLEDRALRGTTTAIDTLEELEPRTSRLWMGEGKFMDIPPEELRKGDKVLVNTGEAVPVDGVVLSGSGETNEAMLTGESGPVAKQAGDHVFAGTTMTSGHLVVEASVQPSETVFRQIIRLVKAAQSEKPPIQRLADRISAIFVPAVLLIALAAWVVGVWVLQLSWGAALMNAIAVLVISCPCAMGLATPTAMTVGLGRMSRNGLMIKGASTIETLASVRTILFDKTGTLTTGHLKVRQIRSRTGLDALARSTIFQMESRSTHPVARALVLYLGMVRIDPSGVLTDIVEIPGVGMQARDPEGRSLEIRREDTEDQDGLHLALLRDGEKLAHIVLDDEIRPEAVEVIRSLYAKGYTCWMVSGDRESNVRRVAGEVGIDHFLAAQMPQDKFALIERLQASAPLAMVGDGINDAPALEKAAVGIAMAGATHTALQSARVALLQADLRDLLSLFRLSKLTVRTIRENLFWAFAYNIVAIPMAFMGFLNPMWGALFMAFSDLVVIGNSIRLQYRH